MTRMRILLAFLVLVMAGCASVPKVPPPLLPPELSLPDLCRKYDMECSWDAVTQSVTIVYKARRIQAMVGSAVVVAGDESITLSAALRRQKGVVMVPPDLETRVIAGMDSALAGKPPALPRRIGKVVIDAGHGGRDPGAIGPGETVEKEIVLDIAKRLRDGLAKAGVDVVMTRDRDAFPSLEERSQVASAAGIELFISIHANSTPARKGKHSSSAQGVEIFFAAPLSAKDLSEAQRRKNERSLLAQLSMDHDSPEVGKIVLDMLYGQKIYAGPRLAAQLMGRVEREMPEVRLRGVKSARFSVLRNTLVPAVLIETGFVTNPREARLLRDPVYRQQLAGAFVDSIVGYLYDPGL